MSARSSSSKSKLVIVCGLSSSVMEKSDCFSPRTTAPLLSRTTTFTVTSSVPDLNTGAAAFGGACVGVCARGATISAITTIANAAARGNSRTEVLRHETRADERSSVDGCPQLLLFMARTAIA